MNLFNENSVDKLMTTGDSNRVDVVLKTWVIIYHNKIIG